MSHQALYRRFRPKSFDDVIGQEHLTKTLKNQILTDNIAHAYLFCGIRGTGKTSTAKIFARAINCIDSHDGNPCNKCEICESILNETNMDVIEMDAASNNSVDDIRELRDKVKFLPVRSKYKVYIIDEVHMLSKGAFNALLKTLEEPPEHLVFILATTEPHKIPATILSRCQRFDLKRISTEDMVNAMKSICEEIGVNADDKALRLIAGNSEGAMRDALSILDRCITFNQEAIDYDTVINLLGTVNFETVVKIADSLIQKDITKALSYTDEVLSNGKDLLLFIEEVITYFRNLLIYKTTKSKEHLIKISDDVLPELEKHADSMSVEEIVYYIEKLSETGGDCKRSINPRILLETRLIKLMDKENSENTALLEKRIEQLEHLIKSGGVLARTNNEAKHSETGATKHIQETKKASNQSVRRKLGSDEEEQALKKLKAGWSSVLDIIRNESRPLHAVVRESKIADFKNNTAIVEYDKNFTFHLNKSNEPKNKAKVKEAISKILDADVNVEFRLKNDGSVENNDNSTNMDDIYNDMKDIFGEDKVELK